MPQVIASSRSRSAVVELRQYVLRPGARERLIDLFDRELVETQEACGIEVIGQFRDLDRPDVFTWIRGFRDMSSRASGLRSFYEGPEWTRHRELANATMISFDNVRLLRPAASGTGFHGGRERPAVGTTDVPGGVLVATIYTLVPTSAVIFPEWFQREMAPILHQAGASPVASFETDPAANMYPRLPVREGEHSFVWFARFANHQAIERHLAALETNARWSSRVAPALAWHLEAPALHWHLTPTARSRLVP